jgi:hypothetical protein
VTGKAHDSDYFRRRAAEARAAAYSKGNEKAAVAGELALAYAALARRRAAADGETITPIMTVGEPG